jgi:NitT/TauT family transport system substrate-binding protein
MTSSKRSSFLALCASSLAVGAPVVARSQTPTALRVACTASDAYAEGIYARDLGYFAKAGLNVDLSLLGGGSPIVAAVASGALDIGIATPIPLALAYLHGIPFAYFCSGGLYNPDESALCVLADGPILTAKDLEGKIVGSPSLSDANTVAVRAFVDQNGGDSTKVRFVEVAFSAMLASLQRGIVAAAPIVEPALSEAKKQGGIRVLMPPYANAFGKNALLGGWFARTDWLKANAAVARRFATVIYSTAKWANTHPNESADLLANAAKLDPLVVRGMSRAPYGDTLDASMLQPILDLTYKYKVIDRHINASEIIYKV